MLFEPDIYGKLILAQTTVGFLSILSIGWIAPSIVRFFPKYDLSEKNRFYSTFFTMLSKSVFIISILFLIVILILKNWMDAHLYNLLLIGIFVFISSSFYSIFLDIFRARAESKNYTVSNIIYRYLSLFLGIFFVISLGTGVEGILFGQIVATLAILSIIVYFYFIKKEKIKLIKPSKKIKTEMSSYGVPILFSALSGWILRLSDRYLIEIFRGSFEVGLYSITYTIAEKTIFLVGTTFISALIPLIINTWEKNRDLTEPTLRKMTRYFFLLTLPTLFGLNALSPQFFQILTTPAYFAGNAVLPFISCGIFFQSLYSIVILGLSMQKKARTIFLITFVAAIINISLNLIFIPKYGFYGASITTFLSYLIMLLGGNAISSKYLEWKPPLISFCRILFASVAMGVAVFYLGKMLPITILNTIFEIIAGIAIFTVIIYILGEIKDSEISEMIKFIKKCFGIRI